jgi:hypothetical protein
MLAEFIATETGTERNEHFITTGVACSDPPHFLMFSRFLPIGGNEDWGIEIEFDDQINSGYGMIKSCSLSSGCLRVDLSNSIGRERQYDGFDIALQLSVPDWTSFVTGLRMVFTGQEHLLSVDTQQS